MANNIKGITVNIGGNTQGLDKALKGVNSQAASLQSELREVNRALKLDPTNTELLRQKQELLASSVTETKNKLQTLKQADAQCSEQFKKDHAEQYRALQREIILTEGNLKNLESQAANSNAMVAKISDSADKMAGSLENAAGKTKMLSAAAGGLIAAAGGAAYKAITLSDDLNTLANQTGFTTADLQKMEYAADRIDVSMETITGASKKMKKSMVASSKDTIAAWNAIGVSVTDSNGSLRDSTTVFYEAIEGLSKISNETERDTLAMQIFGKSADDLAGIIDDGGAAFKQYGKEAEDAGVILSQDTLDSLNKMNDAVDELKAQTTGTFAEVGAEVATMLTPCLQDVAGIIKNVLQWVRNLDQGQLKFIGTILLVIAALSPMLAICAKLITIIKGIVIAISTVNGAIALFTGAATTGTAAATTLAKAIAFLTSPITLVVAAVVAAVALIAIKGDEIQAVFQRVNTFMQTIFARDWTNIFGPVLGGLLNTFFATFKGIWDSVMLIFNGVIDFVRGVFTGDWERAWKGITEIFGGIFGSLEAIAKAPINGIIGLLNMAISAINSLISGFNSLGFTMPKWLGGGSWHPNLPSIPSIPFLAKGGTFNQGSAIVGEAGPELLTLIGGAARVTPLTNSQKQIKAAGASFGDINVTVYGQNLGDPKATAKATADELQNEIQRREMVFA
nr:MAG TPA: minor tail protein [Caudoviricetes sp.]